MSVVKTSIQEALKSAMKSGDSMRRDAIRLISAAMKQIEVDERRELLDADVFGILAKMKKQREESIVQYEKASREDLIAKERFEMAVIEGFLPTPLDEAAVKAAVIEAISELKADGIKDMGRVMNHLRTALTGRCDMSALSALVKQQLGGG